MEETYFKRVSVREELPEKDGDWKVFLTDDNNPFLLMWNKVHKSWVDTEGDIWLIQTAWYWLKPLPILSRDKMIAQINEIAADHIIIDHTDKPFIGGKCGEKILDAILKSGLLEKKDILKEIKQKLVLALVQSKNEYKDGLKLAIEFIDGYL